MELTFNFQMWPQSVEKDIRMDTEERNKGGKGKGRRGYMEEGTAVKWRKRKERDKRDGMTTGQRREASAIFSLFISRFSHIVYSLRGQLRLWLWLSHPTAPLHSTKLDLTINTTPFQRGVQRSLSSHMMSSNITLLNQQLKSNATKSTKLDQTCSLSGRYNGFIVCF